MRRLLLPLAVLASIATSQVDGVEPELSSSQVHLYNPTLSPLELEIAVVDDLDCDALEGAPWVASTLSYPDPDPVRLEPSTPTPVVEETAVQSSNDTALLGVTSEICYAARVTRGGSLLGHLVALRGLVQEYTVAPHSLDRLRAGAVVVRDGTLQDSGLGVVQPELPACELLPRPSWSGDLAGDHELQRVERSGDCTVLIADAGSLEVCGLQLPFEGGELLSIESSPTRLSLSAFQGRSLLAYEGLPPSAIVRPNDACTPGAGLARAEVHLADDLLELGLEVVYGEGTLEVLEAATSATPGQAVVAFSVERR